MSCRRSSSCCRVGIWLLLGTHIYRMGEAHLVAASGSGLDPHLSVEAAEIQVPRIAKIRNVNENTIYQLIQSNIEQPLFGIFGTTKVNVLKLNLALDNLN